MSQQEPLLTPEDVERIYGCKRETQRVHRHRGLLSFVRLGGGRLIRYRQADLDAWVAARTVEANR